MGTYSTLASDLQRDLEDANLPSWASVSHRCCKGLAHKSVVFGFQLQAMAQISPLSVSSEEGQRSALRGKRG